MSFMKDTVATVEPLVEANTAPQVVEIGFDHQEGHGASGVEVLDQDLQQNVVVEVPCGDPGNYLHKTEIRQGLRDIITGLR